MAGKLWMPGAVLVPSSHDGGSMLGGGAFVTWHTYEAGYGLSAVDGAQRLIKAGNEVQFTFHPLTGTVAQMLPANRAGRGLRNSSGGAQTNRRGTVNFQVEVIARAAQPWTKDLTPAGKAGLARLMAYFRSWGVPDVFPAGNPPIFPPGNGNRSTKLWAIPGHHCHSQTPENTHGDPGRIDPKVLFAKAPVRPAPKPSRPGVRKPLLTRYLRVGQHDTGKQTAIRNLQKRLRALGYTGVGTPDGDFGPKTLAAVKAFQRKHGLAADGVVGKDTAHALGWAWKG